MQAFEEESKRVLKKQRLCVAQIDLQLDELLTHVESAKQQLEARQQELCRKKNRHLASAAGEREEGSQDVGSIDDQSTGGAEEGNAAEDAESKADDVAVEEQDNETEHIVRDFIRRVRELNVEKNVTSELKAIHVLLSKYSKQIDKVGVGTA
jgi:TolA-binding protein